MITDTLVYRRRVTDLFTGSSLGNLVTFARLDESSNLLGLWSALDNQFYIGQWEIEIAVNGVSAVPTETVFRPESQSTFLQGPDLRAEKLFFLPFGEFQRSEPASPQLQAGIFHVTLTNSGAASADVVISHKIIIPAVQSEKFTKQANADQFTKRIEVAQEGNACTVTTLGRASEARTFGAPEPWDDVSADDRSLHIRYRVTIPGKESRTIPFVVTYSPAGAVAAGEAFLHVTDHTPSDFIRATTRTLKASRDRIATVLSRSFLVTPDPVINRGMQWAKVNTLRIEHQFRTGAGFTNDPPQDIVVIRDLAWFVLGADYFTPSFSRELIGFAERHAFHEGGKLTEFLHADEPEPVQHDYKLNINDDTPLFVYALYHHALVTGDQEILGQFYPLMKRGCDWIIAQVYDGLVRCFAEGTNVWGICSWRNIIDGYNLTGAVTEVNAECYHALLLTARVAKHLGKHEEANRYQSATDALQDQINTRLVSEKSGLFLLNLDNAGVPHHDVTGDLVFPLLFGVASGQRAASILHRLVQPDIWTPFGARTVAPGEPMYDPDFGYQLVGGVWPNLTAWIAFAAKETMPDKVAEGMHTIYSICEAEHPVGFKNLVPGEFPERLHGSTFESRGMAMSPWMPSTYVWLGIEGLMGVRPTFGGLEMNPALPQDWNWVVVKDLVFRNETFDAFLIEGELYSSSPMVTSSRHITYGKRWMSVSSDVRVVSVAIEIDEELCIFAASPEGGTATISFGRVNGRSEKRGSIHVDLLRGEARLIHLGTASTVEGTEHIGYDRAERTTF